MASRSVVHTEAQWSAGGAGQEAPLPGLAGDSQAHFWESFSPTPTRSGWRSVGVWGPAAGSMVVIRGWGLGEEKWGQGRYEVPRWDPSRLWATELESPSYHAEAKLAWTTPAQRTGPSWAWV